MSHGLCCRNKDGGKCRNIEGVNSYKKGDNPVKIGSETSRQPLSSPIRPKCLIFVFSKKPNQSLKNYVHEHISWLYIYHTKIHPDSRLTVGIPRSCPGPAAWHGRRIV